MEKLEESKLVEIQQKNNEVIKKADEAIRSLDQATARKDFGPAAIALVQDVEHQGKEVSRALKWWKDEFMGPIVTAAHVAWKQAVARRDEIGNPLERRKEDAALAVGRWRNAEATERARIEAEERKRREKEEEDARIAAAAKLEQDGATEEAQAVLDTPAYVPPVVLPAAPKTQGSSVRQVWKFRVVNPALVPREFLMVDETKVGAHVRAHKDGARIPGIEVYAESKAAFSSR